MDKLDDVYAMSNHPAFLIGLIGFGGDELDHEAVKRDMDQEAVEGAMDRYTTNFNIYCRFFYFKILHCYIVLKASIKLQPI